MRNGKIRRYEKRTDYNDIQSKRRMPNLDLLRCVAMMMVVVLHYLGRAIFCLI